MKLRELLANQFIKNQFTRVDIVVRYLAIENYFGKNRYGFKLYSKMQRKRRRYSQKNLNRSKKRFRKIIKSFEKKGFKRRSRIVLNSKYKLFDGSHRLACAMFFNIDEIPILIRRKKRRAGYSMHWFRKHGFTNRELRIIR